MIDMKWIRNDPEKVKENIRKKFQDEKLPLVDEVVEPVFSFVYGYINMKI